MHEELRVKQSVDRRRKAVFYKNIVITETADGHRLGMVRKRLSKTKTIGAVMLLHGFGQNHYSWHMPGRSFAAYLAEAGYDVFNAALRGAGRSKKLGAPLPSNFDEYLEYDFPALLGAVKELSGYDKVFLIGHSLGGSLAYAAAPSYADSIAGIITLSGVFNLTKGNLGIMAVCQAHQQLFANMLRTQPATRALPSRTIGVGVYANGFFFNSPIADLFPFQAYSPRSIEHQYLYVRLVRGFENVSIGLTDQLCRWGAEGKFDSFDRTVDYAEEFKKYRGPLLAIGAAGDRMVSPAAAYSAFEACCGSDKTFINFQKEKDGATFGHIDIILGKQAPSLVWPKILNWMGDR